MTAEPKAIPPELKTLAEIALSEARRELEQTGGITVLVNLRMPDGEIAGLRLPAPINELMNSGSGKDRFFGTIRKIVKESGATAVLFATDTWMGMPTAKQKQVIEESGPEKLMAMLAGKSLSDAEAMGLVERKEALSISVQTAEAVLLVTQFYEREKRARRIHFGERQERLFRQDDFDGRQKMYGKEYHAPTKRRTTQ